MCSIVQAWEGACLPIKYGMAMVLGAKEEALLASSCMPKVCKPYKPYVSYTHTKLLNTAYYSLVLHYALAFRVPSACAAAGGLWVVASFAKVVQFTRLACHQDFGHIIFYIRQLSCIYRYLVCSMSIRISLGLLTAESAWAPMPSLGRL